MSYRRWKLNVTMRPPLVTCSLLAGSLITASAARAEVEEWTPPEELRAELSSEQRREVVLELGENFCSALELGYCPRCRPGSASLPACRSTSWTSWRRRAARARRTHMPMRELRHTVRTPEWPVRIHLAAVEDVTLRDAQCRAINAEGNFRDLFTLHDSNELPGWVIRSPGPGRYASSLCTPSAESRAPARQSLSFAAWVPGSSVHGPEWCPSIASARVTTVAPVWRSRPESHGCARVP